MSEPPPGVHNPAELLLAWRKVRALPPEAKVAIAALLEQIEADADARAVRFWRLNKPPQAAYWKSIAHFMRSMHQALRHR